MYVVVAPNGDHIFEGTNADCWQYMIDEGLNSSFRVVAL
jgi:hypothetical protein